ncbi:MAG: hypothetical protein E7298_10050 [Lachnospiraceae bacterium]|nr:hypothetical protein [Lachnospiraceae bacterium]
MQINVVRNAKRNVAFGVVNKVIITICLFVERYGIRHILGAQYLGLESLFSSIIAVLSLSELGFSSAIIYNMYKPAADGDIGKMNALLNFYKKVYAIIGVVIIIIGIILIPFLPKLIKGSYPTNINLIKIYFIYVINTALSYFPFAYLSSVLVVHQRDDVNSMLNSIIKLTLTAAQMIVLCLTKNYYRFLILMPLFTLLNNLLMGWRVHSLFPQYNPNGNISEDDKTLIKKLVTGSFIQQSCIVTRNSLDSVCVSAFLGLTLTAVYNNYFQVMNGVVAFGSVVASSFAGGIGNHVVTRGSRENYQEMKKLDFLYIWFAGWCMICMMCLYQPFMTLWMGRDMLLPMPAVLLFCVYYYMLKLGDIRTLYSSANGLWWEQRYRALFETVLNLVLNILLGKIFGIYGIIVATIISLFLCNYLWAVGIVFRLYFSIGRRKDYYTYQIKQSFIMFIVAAITYILCIEISGDDAIHQLIVRGIICVVIPNVILYLIYRNTDYFKYALNGILARRD